MLRCGLLGRKLGHSYSPQIHHELASYEYKLYEKEPEELNRFLKSGTFDGLNVTIPYKKAVMPLLDEISPEAAAIGSVNTIVNRAGKLTGYNTDAFGFTWLLQKSGVDVAGKKALVFGSGGASVTVCHVLKSLGADPVVVISRSGENNYENLDRHTDAKILVNATPLGMYPGNGVSPVDLTCFDTPECVLDVVYNPARTALILQAEALHIPHASGLSMLVAQAKKACEYFTDTKIPDTEIDRIERLLSHQMQNIILIGMSKDTFAPNKTMTRAEFAAIVTRALGLPAKDTKAFTDVPSSKWYAGYIGAANSSGIVNGVGSGKFNPDGTITRQEAAVMVARAAKLCGLDTEMDAGATKDVLAQFGDYRSVASWAKESLAFCYYTNILDQSALKIEPTKAILRYEIAQMLYNMLVTAELI